MSLVVKSRSKSLKADTYDSIVSFEGFLTEVSSRNKKINKNRIRITTAEGKPITSDEELLKNAGGEVVIKDLGPQIGWRLVYLIEYAGPILFHVLGYKYFGEPSQYELIYRLNLIHYIKREVENIFVHKFSNSTMPLFNLFKNCFHYWVLGSSLLLQYGGYGNFTIPNYDASKYTKFLLAFWIFCEFFNGITHIQLRLLGDKTLRQGKKRELPKGGFFELFIAPNYTFEIYGWIVIFLLNPNVFSLMFLVVGAVQMYLWTKKKNARYGNTKRKFLIPLIF